MRMLSMCVVFLALVLAGCGSRLTECIFSEMQVEWTDNSFIVFNLVLAGNGTTNGAVFSTERRDGIPYAPTFRTLKTFINTGEPYVQQYYGDLEPGTYRLNVWSNGDRKDREITLQEGRSYMLQAQCP